MTVTALAEWSCTMKKHTTSVVMRQRVHDTRNDMKRMKSVEGISLLDEQDISHINLLLARIDERHRQVLGLSHTVAVPKYPRAISADHLSPAQLHALRARTTKRHNERNHDPAA